MVSDPAMDDRAVALWVDACLLPSLSPLDSRPFLKKDSQRSILKNSLLNSGFIPAYMKGLMVLDKVKQKAHSS